MIKRFLLFIAPLLIITLFVELRLRAFPTQMQFLKDTLDRGVNKTEVLILGTSHMEQGVDPALFSYSTINAGLPVQSLTVASQLGEKYVDRLKSVKLVILEFAYFSRDFTHSGSYRGTEARLYDYFQILGLRGDADLKNLLDLRYYSRFFALGREVALTKLIEKNAITEEAPTERGLSSVAAEKEVSYHEALMQSQRSSLNLHSLKRFVQFLRSRSIPLVLVAAPTTHYYQNAIGSEKYNQVKNAILEAAGSEGVTFKDYLNHEAFTIQDFYNVDHLNAAGRAKFSSLLNTEVVVPYFKQRQLSGH